MRRSLRNSCRVAAVVAVAAVLVPVRPVGAAVGVVDAFSRDDASSLGSAPTGQDWIAQVGSWRIASGEAAPASDGYVLATIDAGAATGTWTVVVHDVGPEFWIIVRASGSGSYWRFGRWGNGGYELQQVTGGVLGSPLVSTLAAPVPADGDVLACALAAEIRCSVNGVPVATTNDPFNAAATSVGFAAYGPNQPSRVRFDDVSFDDLVDGPDVAIVMTDRADPVVEGEQISYLIVVSNHGRSAATAVRVEDPLPPEVTFTSATTSQGLGCAVLAGTVECDLGDIAAGAAASVQLVVQTTGARTVTNTVSASPLGADARSRNDVATQDTTVLSATAASVVDTFDRADADALGTATSKHEWSADIGGWAVREGQAAVSAAGYAMATVDARASAGTWSVRVPTSSSEFWVIVRASDPANYWRFGRWHDGTYQLQQVRGNSLGDPRLDELRVVAANDADTLACRLAADIVCSVNGDPVVRTDDRFNATATRMGIAAFAPDSPPEVRFDDVSFSTTGANLRADVTDHVDGVVVGERFRYLLMVENVGNGSASDVRLEHDLPSSLSFVAASVSPGTGCTHSGAVVTCSVGAMAAGASATATVVVDATATGAATSTVTAQLGEADSSPADNAATITTAVHAAPSSTTVSDAFARPDGALGVAASGHPWSVSSGTWKVVGGRAESVPGPLSIASVNPQYPFGTFEATVTGGTGFDFATLFRVVDGRNFFRVGVDPAGSGFYRVHKIVDGALQVLDYSFHRADVRPRDGDVIRVVARPDDGVFVAVNGVHVFDGGDAQFLEATRFGLLGNGNVSFDDVTVSATMASVTTTDTFTRPNTSTGLGRPESGARYAWQSPFESTWGVADAAAWHTGTGFGMVIASTSSELADVAVTLRAAAGEAWLVFRYGGPGAYYRFGHVGGSYTVQKVDGYGLGTVPGLTAVATVAPADGQRVEVRQALDGAVECVVDGTVTHRFADTAFHPRSPYYGMAASGSSGRFDDLVIAPRPLRT